MSERTELEATLKEYAKAYYIDNKPVVSDKVYDQKLRRLKELEVMENVPEAERLSAKVRFGVVANTMFAKVPHCEPMLSLDNAFSQADLDNWCKDIRQDTKVYVTPKMDGASLSLEYEKGQLVRILRRGDGEIGDDVTHLKEAIAGITLQRGDTFTGAVRGEIICITFNSEFAHNYKNHRNFVSGSINLKDVAEVAKRKLTFVAHGIIPTDGDYKEEVTKFNKFNCFSWANYETTISWLQLSEILNFFEQATFPFPIDGVVVRIADATVYESLGATSHHPRGAIAIKPEAETKETRLLDVHWQVGSTGNVTPVAILEPVELEGTTVQKCTLHNLNIINSLDIAINDIVSITKAAYIIPKITGVVSRPANRVKINISHCPSCGSKLIQQGAYLKCTNDECGNKSAQQLLKFVQAADYKGFGKATIQGLVDNGVDSLVKFLTMDRKDIFEVVDSDIMADKLMETLESATKAMTFTKVLYSINIPWVGKSGAEKLVAGGITDLFQLKDIDTVSSIPTFGVTKAEQIRGFILDNHEELENLSKLLPLKITDADVVKPADLTKVCITGKVSVAKNKAKEQLLKHGFELQDNVTKATEILIVGDKPGNDKIAKAHKYGTTMVTYSTSDFTKII